MWECVVLCTMMLVLSLAIIHICLKTKLSLPLLVRIMFHVINTSIDLVTDVRQFSAMMAEINAKTGD